MLTLRDRILGALALQPMSAPELACCLSARRTYVQRLLADLRHSHVVRYEATQRIGWFRPWQRFQLVNCHPLNAREVEA